jgi:hypothetical protein
MSKQKEELIIRLLKEGKTYKQIANEAHASPNQITSINRRLEGNTTEPNTRNKAYVMFKEGKNLIDVAIALQIDNIEATRYWNEYLQLMRKYQLSKIGDELKGNFLPFFNMYKVMKSKNWTIDKIKAAIDVAEDIDNKKLLLANLNDGIAEAQQKRDDLDKDVSNLHQEKAQLEHIVSKLQDEVEVIAAMRDNFYVDFESSIQNKSQTENAKLRSVSNPYDYGGNSIQR